MVNTSSDGQGQQELLAVANQQQDLGPRVSKEPSAGGGRAGRGSEVQSSAHAAGARVWVRKTVSSVSPDRVSSPTVPETVTRPWSTM